ncbi:cation-translocating P-type ATPase [Elongatibacter sediminis]|uniref:HAD-IC family P-type ATPase n=1 Tax=Elongatibacter sediminis TaxID=3119006 RepID=A0AAW9R721_9GAMM
MENPDRPWHGLGPEAALTALESAADSGLRVAEVEARRRQHGPNDLPEGPRRSVWRSFFEQFQSPLIYILFIAALFAFALGRHGDSAVILIVVIINALIGWFQEGRAARAMEALRRLSSPRARVVRDGEEVEVDTRDLVPGDLLVLAAGDGVGADARLVESSALEAAEATLTGESLPVRKSVETLAEDTLLADRANMVYSGTYITAGHARAVVTATGTATEMGKIARMTVESRAPKTPLERSIAQFGRYLVAGAVTLFVAVMSFGLMRGMDTVEIFMVAISQMVSMVPEGLPVAMTIALAVGMQRMAGHGAIVRRLSAVETLGSTRVICADKTGTLTRNEMTVTAVWLAPGRIIDITGAGYQPRGDFLEHDERIDPTTDPALATLLTVAALCNDARLVPPDGSDTRWRALGDPTEAALLTAARKAGIDLDDLGRCWHRHGDIPFDADAGMMATAHCDPDSGDSFVAFKGAPEAIVAMCGHVWDNGSAEPLDERRRELVLKAAATLAGRALRVLAFARVDGTGLDATADFSGFAGRLTLLGLAGEMDPPRNEVRRAVEQCRQAGMRPVMVTGDHKLTGMAVAESLGIAGEGDLAIDGSELSGMADHQLREKAGRAAVFARVHPEQKLRIVKAYQDRGEVVAMTGDGVNDAPALIKADVGVAMGLTGTEVAKSAAEIVITDDNFATIVHAVREGRLVHRNLRKVILYLFATSMAEIVVLMSALLLGYPLPLAAVQILWINIVTEGTVTVNLIMEPPEGDEMRQRPVELNRPLLSADLLKRVALMTPVMAASTFSYFAWRVSQGVPLVQVQTETFTVLAACQWFNVVNCQSATRSAFGLGLMRNRWMLGGLILSVLLQVLVLYWPPMNALFHTQPVAVADVGLMVLTASSVLWAEEIRKFFVRLRLRSAPE